MFPQGKVGSLNNKWKMFEYSSLDRLLDIASRGCCADTVGEADRPEAEAGAAEGPAHSTENRDMDRVVGDAFPAVAPYHTERRDLLEYSPIMFPLSKHAVCSVIYMRFYWWPFSCGVLKPADILGKFSDIDKDEIESDWSFLLSYKVYPIVYFQHADPSILKIC